MLVKAKSSNKEQYLDWLSERMEPRKISDICKIYERVDTYCLKNNIIEVPLLWHRDKKTIKRVKETVKKSKVFKFYHRGIIEETKEAINLFYTYLDKEKKIYKNQPSKSNSNYLKDNTDLGDTSVKHYHIVDFNETGDYSYSKPYSYSYFGEIYDNFTTWKGLYVSFINVLMEDYDYIIEDLKNKSLNSRNGRMDIVNINDKNKLVSPKEIANNLFVETNLSSIDIIKKIKSLLEICLIDYENVKITYILNEQSRQTNKEFMKEIVEEKTDIDKIKKYRKILIDKFPRNFRYDSGLEIRKFKTFWAQEFTDNLLDNDLEIENNIRKITILYTERDRKFALVPETILKEKSKQELLAYIEHLFESGKNAIYYNALYEEVIDIFYGSKINNADMLREYLKYIYEDTMIFKVSYFSQENIKIDPILEVKNYLINKEKPVEQEIICNDLLHIPRSRIVNILHSNKEFIRNSPGVYLHPDSIIISESELSEISSFIGYEIELNGFLTETEFIKFIKNHLSGIVERHYQLTDLGLRDVIGYKLQDYYSFNSKIISEKEKKLSVSDIFEIFCNKNERVTLSELKILKKELNSVIYFNIIYNKKLRINEEEFVSKELVNFDIDKIDNAIDEFCPGEYIAIQDIKYFFSFPECRFKWNSYLLEHYVAEYSKKYKLVHINFNENSCVGGIVKVSSKIKTFYDLVVKALLDGNIILDTSKALNYLYKKGYLGCRSYKYIDKAIVQVKAMNQKKG